MIGNFPQAFSHIGLVNAAWAISQAQVRAAEATVTPASVQEKWNLIAERAR